MTNILVTGANGQLGRCLKDAASQFSMLNFNFKSKEELPINNTDRLTEYFNNNEFDYCINTAAYTNVEKAENEPVAAREINATSVEILSKLCEQHKVTLIHISTDYVFDGLKESPYTESDMTNPINIYGETKLLGEQYIRENTTNYFILRTSWLYSQYGHNFFKTIRRLTNENKALKITDLQTGAPTNANDLALAILLMVSSHSRKYGIYHYSNKGKATWHDFAEAIIEYDPELPAASVEKSNDYVTFAERPKYSVMNCTKFSDEFNVSIRGWRESLQSLILSINQNNSI